MVLPFGEWDHVAVLPVTFAPAPGEGVLGWLERLARLFGFPRYQDFLKQPPISYRERCRDYDRSLPSELEALLEHVALLEQGTLQRHLTKDPWLMIPACRTAVCPVCWLEDLKEKRTPYRRCIWSSPVALCCHFHRFPLVDLVELPETERQLVGILEPFFMQWVAAARTISPVVEALIAFEKQLRCSAETTLAYMPVLNDLMGIQHRHYGSWYKNADSTHRLALYQFQAKGALSYKLLFEDRVLELQPKEEGDDQLTRPGLSPKPLNFTTIPSVGYRRHLIYGSLDILSVLKMEGVVQLHKMFGQYTGSVIEIAASWSPETLQELMAFAETVMPSRLSGAVRHPSRKSLPVSRSSAWSGP